MFVEELEKVLAFNDKLTLANKHLDARQFAVGIGPVSLLGKKWQTCIFYYGLYAFFL